jgi:hypothetical protein
MRPSNGDLFASEFSHENYDTNFSKTVMLLNFSPRKHNLQSHNCVKSLVRLDIFKKAGIVHRPKQWEGWELKKWQFWEQNLYKIETMWCRVHQEEHKQMVCCLKSNLRQRAFIIVEDLTNLFITI